MRTHGREREACTASCKAGKPLAPSVALNVQRASGARGSTTPGVLGWDVGCCRVLGEDLEPHLDEQARSVLGCKQKVYLAARMQQGEAGLCETSVQWGLHCNFA